MLKTWSKNEALPLVRALSRDPAPALWLAYSFHLFPSITCMGLHVHRTQGRKVIYFFLRNFCCAVKAVPSLPLSLSQDSLLFCSRTVQQLACTVTQCLRTTEGRKVCFLHININIALMLLVQPCLGKGPVLTSLSHKHNHKEQTHTHAHTHTHSHSFKLTQGLTGKPTRLEWLRSYRKRRESTDYKKR